MDAFTRDHLRRLMENGESACVSIFMPAHRTGREIREDSLLAKNLLTEAERRLQEELGLGSKEAREIVEPAWKLQKDGEFWQSQSDGLALFMAPGMFERFRVPLRFEPLVVAEDHFHVKPLLSLLQGDGEFYLLAASQNRVRLLRGSRFHIDEVDAGPLPKSLREALRIDEYTESVQKSGYRPAGGGATRVMVHGHGGSGGEVEKDDELRPFFQRIGDGFREYMRDIDVGRVKPPLVFAGVESLFPFFRDAIKYERVVEEPVTGNPDELSAKDLHESAWKVVAPLFETARTAALDRFRERVGSGLAMQGNLALSVRGAREGAVDTLLIPRGRQVWGKPGATGEEAEIHAERQKGDRDLLDAAAVWTLLQDGEVFVLEPDEMPDGSDVVTILRRPLAPTSPTSEVSER